MPVTSYACKICGDTKTYERRTGKPRSICPECLSTPRICACGCGEVVIQKYKHRINYSIVGHIGRLCVHTKETREKISKSNKGRTSPNKGKHLSAIHRERISAANKGRTLTSETIRKIKDTKSQRTYVYSEEHRRKVSKALSERIHKPESIEKQSQTRKKLWAAGVYENVTFFTSYSKPTRYKGIRMRSKFEAKIAKIMDSNGVRWFYEPQRFVFAETSYRPDFYLPELGIWIECKYRNDPEEFTDLYKVDLLRQLGYHVSIVTFEDIRYIREEFIFVGEGENLMLMSDTEGEE
jgi:hypothetical protein